MHSDGDQNSSRDQGCDTNHLLHHKESMHLGRNVLTLVLTSLWIACEGSWKGRQGQLPRTKIPIPKPSSNRKLGPPSRRSIQPKLPTTEEHIEQAKTGRVSVHCVGSSINLPELRAHVFRRGFGTGGSELMVDDIIDRMALKLDRSDSEEYLHISNEPMFVSTQVQGSMGSSGESDYVKVGIVKNMLRTSLSLSCIACNTLYCLSSFYCECVESAICDGNKLLVPGTAAARR